jgi:hypothetical protein
MRMPGFEAASSLGPTNGTYQGNALAGSAQGSGGVVPQQFLLRSGVDLGAYLRCRANGGGELVCRFFGGLPPFTIGGRLM